MKMTHLYEWFLVVCLHVFRCWMLNIPFTLFFLLIVSSSPRPKRNYWARKKKSRRFVCIHFSSQPLSNKCSPSITLSRRTSISDKKKYKINVVSCPVIALFMVCNFSFRLSLLHYRHLSEWSTCVLLTLGRQTFIRLFAFWSLDCRVWTRIVEYVRWIGGDKKKKWNRKSR